MEPHREALTRRLFRYDEMVEDIARQIAGEEDQRFMEAVSKILDERRMNIGQQMMLEPLGNRV